MREGGRRYGYRGWGGRHFEQIEKWVRGVGVVSAEGLQAELPVHEDDGVAGFEEVFGGGGASRSCGWVSHGLRVGCYSK